METLTEYIGKWVGISFFVINQYNEKEKIHPDDWSILDKYEYVGCVHKCVGI